MRTTREKLVDDFAEMLTEAEDLMKRAANETGERAKDLRTQVEAKLLAAKLRLQELQGEAIDSANRTPQTVATAPITSFICLLL